MHVVTVTCLWLLRDRQHASDVSQMLVAGLQVSVILIATGNKNELTISNSSFVCNIEVV